MAQQDGKKGGLFRKDDVVYVFYRMSKRCAAHRKYMAVLDPRHGAYRPRCGLSDGWVPGRVAKNYDGSGTIEVEYAWNHFYTQRGQLTNSEEHYAESFPIKDVMEADALPSGPLSMQPPSFRPDLAIITFRWGGLNEVVAPQQWGSTGSSVSDTFIDSFTDIALAPSLGNGYEIWTVYIENHSDMVKIADTAHLIFGPNHPARRAKQCCAMYFLYPTGFEENCVPTRETGEDGGAALVDQKSFFRMMKSMERASIPTRFPHSSGFYELLASKRWTAMMSLTPHLRVPPTIGVPRMMVEQGCKEAAQSAMEALEEVRKQQALLRKEPAPQEPIIRGVAKLGFSWEALDVKFWEGVDGLEEALHALTQVIEISEELTGQPHDLESIMVQEYCYHDFELRLYVVDGKVEASIYTKFCKIKENNEFGDFHELFEDEEAANEWMEGDVAALKDGKRQCEEITNHWLTWVRTQTCEPPPAIRFDYFVGRKGPSKAQVWTLEICELGFSMLGEESLPAKVFQALLRSMLRENAAPAGEQAKIAVVDDVRGSTEAKVEREKKKAAKAPASSAPETLWVLVPPLPNLTDDQIACTGKYNIISTGKYARGANRQPVWSHERNDESFQRYLYMGNDKVWYIGDQDEEAVKFNIDQGYIRHDSASNPQENIPHLLRGPWDKAEPWEPLELIRVSAEPIDFAEAMSRGKGKSGGHKGKDGKRK